jgi:DNA polymerase-1
VNVFVTANEFLEWFNARDMSICAFDFETTALSYLDLDLVGVSFWNGTDGCYVDYQLAHNDMKPYVLEALETALSKVEILCAHNVEFELRVLRRIGVEYKGKIYCTKVGDHLIDETRRNGRHGLKYLAGHILGYDTKKYDEVANDFHNAQFYEYAINDSKWCYELMQYQLPILKEEGTFDLMMNIEMPFQYVLVDMHINGIDIDKQKVVDYYNQLVADERLVLKEMWEQVKHFYKSSQQTLVPTTPEPINFNSSQQVADLMFNKLKLEPIGQSKLTGKDSTGKEFILAYKDTVPFVKVFAKYKVISKLLSGFIKPLPNLIDKDGKLRPGMNDCGTDSGRLSSSKPNIQQLAKPNELYPVNLRGCFIAPKGYKMIACDFSAQEVRVMTDLSNEPNLIKMLEKNQDPHLKTAKEAFGADIPDEALSKDNPDHETYLKKYKKLRGGKAKTFNFALPYGKSAFGFSKDFKISEEEAQDMLDRYFTLNPGLKIAIDQCHKEVLEQGWVATKFGRRRHFQKFTYTDKFGNKVTKYSSKALRASFNFKIQGYSADMMRKAMIDVRKITEKYKYLDIRPIFTVHDESVYVVPEKHAETAKNLIVDAFERCVKLCVPVKAEASIGNNYGECK